MRYLDTVDYFDGGLVEAAENAQPETAAALTKKVQAELKLKQKATAAALVGYLRWAASVGFVKAYIWACPPKEGGPA